ncbi:hypothetical protein C8D77_10953 [Mesorhizobium loti]|uniref:Uncharacterized protein n=1 Tax=Rhizobium loti TaxID=381 RepID=A0A8E3B3A4_RHILI|nr:hypothetical protein [Mesorhizobium loti]PWJ88835.1 hypothetical protein C8D77_10953 [Mesorhizobium loti]
MRLFSRPTTAFAVAMLCLCLGTAHAQDLPENIPWANSVAIAEKMATGLLGQKTGSKDFPAASFAVAVDLNLDGFAEIFAYRHAPDCDGIRCGNFMFVLEGNSYHEVLGDIPGARLAPQDKIALGAFKRNGFLDMQFDQMTISWDGKRYADASSFPASSLDGAAFLTACQKSKSNEQPADGEAERVSAECQCQLNRFQVTSFTQADLDMYTASLGENFDYPTGGKEIAWQALLKNAEDVGTGCNVASGKSQWPPAYFNHGDQPQQKLNFDGFLDACPAQAFILTNHKIGSPDRALTLCGCLAREVPTQGIGQEGLDLLTQYYRDEISDADVEAQAADVLAFHDKASEACLSQFPAK